eukprot:733282-Karenia_brevis.AAC.1
MGAPSTTRGTAPYQSRSPTPAAQSDTQGSPATGRGRPRGEGSSGRNNTNPAADPSQQPTTGAGNM